MLNIDPYTIVFTLINLLILYVAMKKVLFKPINNILESRAKDIQDNLEQAERQRKEAEELKAQYEEQMAQSRQQASKLLSQAKAQSQEVYQKTVADAQAEAKKVMNAGTERNRHDREIMLKSVREEVASLVVEAALRQNFVPVVDGRNVLCGIVTRRNLIAAMADGAR